MPNCGLLLASICEFSGKYLYRDCNQEMILCRPNVVNMRYFMINNSLLILLHHFAVRPKFFTQVYFSMIFPSPFWHKYFHLFCQMNLNSMTLYSVSLLTSICTVFVFSSVVKSWFWTFPDHSLFHRMSSSFYWIAWFSDYIASCIFVSVREEWISASINKCTILIGFRTPLLDYQNVTYHL